MTAMNTLHIKRFKWPLKIFTRNQYTCFYIPVACHQYLPVFVRLWPFTYIDSVSFFLFNILSRAPTPNALWSSFSWINTSCCYLLIFSCCINNCCVLYVQCVYHASSLMFLLLAEPKSSPYPTVHFIKKNYFFQNVKLPVFTFITVNLLIFKQLWATF